MHTVLKIFASLNICLCGFMFVEVCFCIVIEITSTCFSHKYEQYMEQKIRAE